MSEIVEPQHTFATFILHEQGKKTTVRCSEHPRLIKII